MKTRPSEDDKPKSGGGGIVIGSRAGTEIGGRVEKTGNKRRCWRVWIMDVLRVLVINNNKYKNYYRNNARVQINVPKICITPVRLGNHRISLARRAQVMTRETFYRRT